MPTHTFMALADAMRRAGLRLLFAIFVHYEKGCPILKFQSAAKNFRVGYLSPESIPEHTNPILRTNQLKAKS